MRRTSFFFFFFFRWARASAPRLAASDMKVAPNSWPAACPGPAKGLAEALLAVLTYDAEAKGNFFLRVASMGGHFTPGLFVVFAFGMLSHRTTARAAVAAMVAAPVFSFLSEPAYATLAGQLPGLAAQFGTELNFLHRVVLTALFACLVLVVLSRFGTTTEHQRAHTIAAVQKLPRDAVRRTVLLFSTGIVVLLGLGVVVEYNVLTPRIAAVLAAILALALAFPWVRAGFAVDKEAGLFGNDRAWAALLMACTLFLMFEFY